MNEIRHFVPRLARRIYANVLVKGVRFLFGSWPMTYDVTKREGHLMGWTVGLAVFCALPILTLTVFWRMAVITQSEETIGQMIFWAATWLVSCTVISIRVELERYREEKQNLIRTIRGDE
jgi:hypothetical protein